MNATEILIVIAQQIIPMIVKNLTVMGELRRIAEEKGDTELLAALDVLIAMRIVQAEKEAANE